MAIVWKFDADGGFVAGDTESRRTSYAYATSIYADRAKKKPAGVAAEMVGHEGHWPPGDSDWLKREEARRWSILDEGSV